MGLWKTYFHWSVLLGWAELRWILGILLSVGGLLLKLDQYQGANVCFVAAALFVFAKIAQVAITAGDPLWHRLVFTFLLFGISGVAIVETVRGVNRLARSKQATATTSVPAAPSNTHNDSGLPVSQTPSSSPPSRADQEASHTENDAMRNLRIAGGQEIRVSYAPQSNILRLEFKAVLENYGGMDVINHAQAKLWRAEMPKPQSILFGPDEVTFAAPDGPRSLPFSLKEKSPVELDVKAVRKLGTDTFDAFFDHSGLGMPHSVRKHILELDLRTEAKRDSSLRLCFEFTNDVLSEVRKGAPRRFRAVGCD